MRPILFCAGWPTLLLAFLLCSGPATAQDKGDDGDKPVLGPKVCFLPLGKYDPKLLGKAVKGVKQVYGFRVRVLERESMPQSTFYAPRKRYRADKLLDFIDREVIPDTDCEAIIGFTSKDISTTKGKHKDWGIFGLGSINGSSCIVSTYRLGRKTKSRRRVIIRTVKVVNHELGHVLGLGHCPKEGCLMNDAEGTIKTVDNESGLFCDLCRKQVNLAHKVELPVLEEVDWDKIVADQ